METMELTQDEIALVTKHRQQKEARAQQDVLTLYCLETAAKFEAWRQTGGYGMSYSTFLNDFEYQDVVGLNHKVVFERVCLLLKIARNGTA